MSVPAALEPPSLGQKVGLFRYLVGRDMEADEALFQRALDRGVSLSHVLHFVGDGPGESKKTNLPFELSLACQREIQRGHSSRVV